MYGADVIPIERCHLFKLGNDVPVHTTPYTMESHMFVWNLADGSAVPAAQDQTATMTGTAPQQLQPQPQPQQQAPRVSNIHSLLNPVSDTSGGNGGGQQATAPQVSVPGSRTGTGSAIVQLAPASQEQPSAALVVSATPDTRPGDAEAPQAPPTASSTSADDTGSRGSSNTLSDGSNAEQSHRVDSGIVTPKESSSSQETAEDRAGLDLLRQAVNHGEGGEACVEQAHEQGAVEEQMAGDEEMAGDEQTENVAAEVSVPVLAPASTTVRGRVWYPEYPGDSWARPGVPDP